MPSDEKAQPLSAEDIQLIQEAVDGGGLGEDFAYDKVFPEAAAMIDEVRRLLATLRAKGEEMERLRDLLERADAAACARYVGQAFDESEAEAERSYLKSTGKLERIMREARQALGEAD